MPDFLEMERGYANFYKGLIRILRLRDVEAFKRHIAKHPREAGRFSHVLGLSKEYAEIEMYKIILRFKNLKELHMEAMEFLRSKGVSPDKDVRGSNKRHKRGSKPRLSSV